MNSKHLVDSELAPTLAHLPSYQFTTEVLPQVRALLEETGRQGRAATPAPEVTMEERFIPGPKGAPDVRVLIFGPAKSEGLKAGYVYMHGGGYIMGSADMFVRQAGVVIGEIGCVVVAVDYRLAPETPHPGPVEDCYAALKWLHDNVAELGVDPTRIGIGGDSAGGGLTAALGLLARDRGELPVCYQMLNYPMLDDRTAAVEEPHPYAGEFVWDAASNLFGWQSLLGQAPGGPDVSPYAAAARAEDVSGLPPTFIGCGSLDLFLEENIEFARRLLHAGVATELHIYAGAFHGSDLMIEDAAISKRYHRDRLDALKRGLAAK